MAAIPTTSSSDSRGFTLVEVLMAMLIMTVGLLGLLQSMTVAFEQTTLDRLREEATSTAEDAMHDLRKVGFSALAKVGTYSSARKIVGGVPCTFLVARQMEDIGGGDKPTKKIAVMVSWSVKQKSYSHEIYTLRTKRDDE